MTATDVDDLALFDDDYTYGPPPTPAWVTPPHWDAEHTVSIRRPEVLDDPSGWWHDLESWAGWAVITFRLGHWFPPCWPQHPALVEELMGLWLAWQTTWQGGSDANSPTMWLHTLDMALNRVDRLWRAPCDLDRHQSQIPADASTVGTPGLHRWWGNPNYRKDPQP